MTAITANPGTTVECPGCEAPTPPAQLEAHLQRAHGFVPSEARRIAREVLRDLEPGSPAPKVEPRPIVVAPSPRPAPKSHRANPAACATCRKLAPERCRRHGGPGKSTAFRGQPMPSAKSGRGVYHALRLMVALEQAPGTATEVSARAGTPVPQGWMVLKRLVGHGLATKTAQTYALSPAGVVELADVRGILSTAVTARPAVSAENKGSR